MSTATVDWIVAYAQVSYDTLVRSTLRNLNYYAMDTQAVPTTTTALITYYTMGTEGF